MADDGAIDAEVWESVLSNIDGDDSGWSISSALDAASKATADAAQSKILGLLAAVMSPMLKPEDWHSPYTPVAVWDGRRSFVPDDLDADDLALLAALVPHIEHPLLRARAADIAWTYGDRRSIDMAVVAIGAFAESPLTSGGWNRDGREHWQRALELAMRLGKPTSAVLLDLRQKLTDRFLSSDVSDRFFATSLSALLSSHGATAGHKSMGQKAQALAEAAKSDLDYRLARMLLRQAAGWYRRASEQGLSNACIAAEAECYLLEADQRDSTDMTAAFVVGSLLEKALAVMRSLPNKYRVAAGIDEQVREVEARLAKTRQESLDQMMPVESDPVDLTKVAEGARDQVSGRSWFAALAALASIAPLSDPIKMRESAVRTVQDHPLTHLFSRVTFAPDGRKVATNKRQPGTDENEDPIWDAIMTEYQIKLGMYVAGLILPALEVINLEHRFTEEDIGDVCAESPGVPLATVHLWTKGLMHGLNSDFGSSAFVLVPQIEALVRTRLKAAGANTMLTSDEGIESEKGLSSLIKMPEFLLCFGSELELEFRALLCSPTGPGLRHAVAHGQLTDAKAYSYDSVYLWWIALRLAIHPLIYRMAESQSSESNEPDAVEHVDRDDASPAS